MDRIDGQPVYSATDLVAFLACEHLTQLERAALAGLTKRPMREDPELDVIRRRGFEHEARYLSSLEAEGRTAVTIRVDGSSADRGADLRDAAAQTIDAMAAGAEVIYQATFFDGTFRGHADFLLRVESPDRPSRWGPWHYEVADTKLARHVKASAVLQICSYVDQLERLQGVQPEWMHVALGGSARAVERLRVDDFMAYYRSARDRFLATLADETPATFPPLATYPEPVEHCDVCRWAAECAVRRRADDHLSLVSGISARQRRALTQRGVATLESLGDLSVPMDPPLADVGAGALSRVHEQARIQLEGRRESRLKYELLLPPADAEVELERGLASLPPPSPGDLFFDIEGDPYALDDGLDYLFGVLETDGTFHAIWSRDDAGEFSLAGERRGFERLMDFIMARLEQDPQMHVYHYAPYEPTAMKRLMGRYGTRENDVDRLLREGVMVDLLRVVRQSLRASVESYSIKKMEAFYGFVREIDLRDAGSSIVAFEQWLELADGERPGAMHLERIERYNKDDVVSNLKLRDWLEGLRTRVHGYCGTGGPAAGAPPRTGASRPDRSRGTCGGARSAPGRPERHADGSGGPESHAAGDLAPRSTVGLASSRGQVGVVGIPSPDGPHARGPRGRGRPDRPPGTHLSGRRRAKGQTDLALPVSSPGLRPRAGRRLRPGEEAGSAGRQPVQMGGRRRGRRQPSRTDARPAACRRRVTSARDRPAPVDRHDGAPGGVVRSRELGRRPRDPGDRADARGTRPPVPAPAACGAVARRACCIVTASRASRPHGAWRPSLDHTTLAIQGPPGSGKTYTGARMVCTLLAAGKRVGITATSHKVIGNFLKAVLEAAELEGVTVLPVQKGDKDEVLDDARVTRATDATQVRARLDDGRANIAAGTTWLWASPKMAESVDVLFVDEAGQISLANVVAIAGATNSLVLLGDPQQLDQPLQGSHPPGADRSALAHVLGDAATMPPTQGLFLESTWRLHPELCAFTSEVFYDDRLEPQPDLVTQRLDAPGASGAGPRLHSQRTEGADNESPAEADAVASLARDIVDGNSTWTDRHGVIRPVTWEDVLIVAPYNAQVGAIRRRLPPEARVGTVDKFQGQEAPVSIYSMTTSTPELAPRGMDFLYSRHRLNVATSRARCVTIVVASPDLLRVRARTPAQMRLANAFCRFEELARPTT